MLHFMSDGVSRKLRVIFLVERSRVAQERATPVEGGLLYTDIMGVV